MSGISVPLILGDGLLAIGFKSFRKVELFEFWVYSSMIEIFFE